MTKEQAMTNPWKLPQGQARVMDALVHAGCAKRAAADLGLSRKTVVTHLTRARQKMGVTTQLQMAILWDRFVRSEIQALEQA